MRVGLVCPYTWAVPGGVQQHIRDLAEALIGLGHDVSVISPADDDTPLPAYVVPAGRAVPVPYNGSVARLAFGFLSASRVRRWVKEGGFDVLHVHEPAAPSLSLLACWVADGPIVATVHTATTRSRVMHASGPALRTALEKVNGWIAVSEAARTTLVEHIGGDAVLIPNGVTVSRYEKARPLPGWPGEGGALGFLGRMDEPRKGLDVLLRAFEELGAQRPGLRLLIAGPGDTDDVLAKVPAPLRPRVILPGQVSEEDKASVYHSVRRLLRTEYRRGKLRHRARRGHGGRGTHRGQRSGRLPESAARRPGGRAVRDRGRGGAGGGGRAAAGRPGAAGRPVRGGRGGGPGLRLAGRGPRRDPRLRGRDGGVRPGRGSHMSGPG